MEIVSASSTKWRKRFFCPFHLYFAVAIVILVLYMNTCYAADAEDGKHMPGFNVRAQKAAIDAWIEKLTVNDMNPSSWVEIVRSNQPQNYFEHYAKILSDVFEENHAMVNFALVGACDGTNDRTIRDRYLPHEHWRGVFVEPFTINYKDLTNFIHDHGVSHRSHLIHGAATNQCNSTTLKMKRPTFEEKNASLPHWMRRQIGSVVPWGKLDRPMTGGWVAEYVRCLTAKDILSDWAGDVNRRAVGDAADVGAAGGSRKLLSGGGLSAAAVRELAHSGLLPSAAAPKSAQRRRMQEERQRARIKRMRLHVLKVDVEGHDYEVLSSFLSDDFKNPTLPLLISFEAKSIKGRYDDLRARMLERGYVVSNFANDGFAMLRTDMIYPKRGRNRNRAGAVGEDDRVVDAESSSEEGAGLEGEVTQRKSRRRGKRRRKGDQRRR